MTQKTKGVDCEVPECRNVQEGYLLDELLVCEDCFEKARRNGG